MFFDVAMKITCFTIIIIMIDTYFDLIFTKNVKIIIIINIILLILTWRYPGGLDQLNTFLTSVYPVTVY